MTHHQLCSPHRKDIVSLCIRYNVPVHMVGGLQNYFCHHLRPGSFLEAVIVNDLKASCMLADETNRHHLWDYIHLFQAHAPTEAWGSPIRFNEWIAEAPRA